MLTLPHPRLRSGRGAEDPASRMSRMARSTKNDTDRSCSRATPSSHSSSSGSTREWIATFLPVSAGFRFAIHGMLPMADIVSILIQSLLALTSYPNVSYTVNIPKLFTVGNGSLALTA